MIIFIEFLDNVIESFEILIAFLYILFVLLHKDEILGCLSHCFGGLFAFLIIAADGL